MRPEVEEGHRGEPQAREHAGVVRRPDDMIPDGPACDLPLASSESAAAGATDEPTNEAVANALAESDPQATAGPDAPAAAELDAAAPQGHEAAVVAPPEAPEATAPPVPDVVNVTALDWERIGAAVDPSATRSRMRNTVEHMEALLDRSGGPRFLFDADREDPDDRAIAVASLDEDTPLWFIGDLHGDLLALEAALACTEAEPPGPTRPRLVFLGDLFDDGGYGLELLLRIFELMIDEPERICVIAGNHDEALRYDGARFSATVSPSDFTDFLNGRLAHEWVARAGKLAVRIFADAPRALFFPDGLLVAHGGFPLTDLHADLLATGNWNDPRCLTDFVWTRAHPKARRKMPNRASRGSQFGHEDFAAFCAVAEALGRPVTHMVRGHDHLDERWALYPAYAAHPVLTTNALSRQLEREAFGPYERVPTIARWVPGAVPQVHRLHVPGKLVREIFLQGGESPGSGS